MSNNPVSFVDPDGGWDGWYNRGGVSYFVDGLQVEDWEFDGYFRNASAESSIRITGSLFAGMHLPVLHFSATRGFGFWVDGRDAVTYGLTANFTTGESSVAEIDSYVSSSSIHYGSNDVADYDFANSAIGKASRAISDSYSNFQNGPDGYDPDGSQPLIFAWLGAWAQQNVTDEAAYGAVRSMVTNNPVGQAIQAYTGQEFLPQEINGTRQELSGLDRGLSVIGAIPGVGAPKDGVSLILKAGKGQIKKGLKDLSRQLRWEDGIGSVIGKFDKFECMPTAKALVKYLSSNGVSGQIIDMTGLGKKGFIWSDKMQAAISTNNRHRAVLVNGKVYDNIHKGGIDFDSWVKDFHSIEGFKLNFTSF